MQTRFHLQRIVRLGGGAILTGRGDWEGPHPASRFFSLRLVRSNTEPTPRGSKWLALAEHLALGEQPDAPSPLFDFAVGERPTCENSVQKIGGFISRGRFARLATTNNFVCCQF